MNAGGKSWERWLAPAGIGYVVVHFLFLTRGLADPGTGAGAVQRAFATAADREMQTGLLYEVSALLLLAFAVGLRAHFRGAGGESGALPTIITGAALGAVVLAFAGSAVIFTLEAYVARLGDPNLTYALFMVWWASFFGYCILLGVLALAASVHTLTARLLPRWIGWLGIVCGLALAGGSLAFFPTGAVMQGTADGVAYIGEILFSVWMIATVVVIARRAPSVAPASARELRAEGIAAR